MSPIDPRDFLRRKGQTESAALTADPTRHDSSVLVGPAGPANPAGTEPQPLTERQQIAVARTFAIQKLGLSRKSSGAVRRDLQRNGFSAAVVEAVIASLVEDQYLDDNRIATNRARIRMGGKAESAYRTTQRLQQMGLSDDSIEAALDNRPPDDALALQALQAKFDHHFAAGFTAVSPELLARMRRFLFSRGFSTTVARDTIRTYLKGRSYHDDDT